MKNHHRKKENTMRAIPMLIRSLGIGFIAIGALGGCSDDASKGPTLSCGPGTTLAPATSQCIPSGDFNVIVDDFVVGEYEMSNVDVPERLTAGIADTRKFTIKNTGEDDRAVVTIRVGIAPVETNIEELRAALEDVGADGVPGTVMVGQVILEDLKAGESREVSVDYFVPPYIEDGLFGVFYAADEVPLVKGADGNYAVDRTADSVAQAQEGESLLGEAAHVFAPATVIVGMPKEPNLRILSAKLDNASFELDFTERGEDSKLTLQSRLSSQALNLTEPVTATFELALPGHVVDVAGQDLGREYFDSDEAFEAAPAETTYKYDANRTFQLWMQNESGFAEFRTYRPVCRSEDTLDEESGEVTQVERCATIFTEQSLDDNFQLGLSNEDLRLLETTQAFASLNPDLDANGEIEGSVIMRVTTPQAEFEGNVADNVQTLPVVFMAPEPADAASEDDAGDDKSATDMAGGDGKSGKAEGGGPYAIVTKKNLKADTYGNDWFNANFSFDSQASRNELGGVALGNYNKEAHRVGLVLMKIPLTLASMNGLSDTGSVLLGKDAKAASGTKLDMQTEVTVFGVKILDFLFEDGWCKTDAGITVCPIASFGTDTCAGATAEDISDKCKQKTRERNDDGKGYTTKDNYTTGTSQTSGTAGGKASSEKKGSRQWRYVLSVQFAIGPVPMVLEVDAGINIGAALTAELVIDRSQGLVPSVGGQFGLGAYAAFDVNVFLGLELYIMRAGIEGSLTIAKVDFIPTVRMLVGGVRDSVAGCWKVADSSLGTTGELVFTGPSGSIGVALYVGKNVCVFGKCWNLEIQVFSYTIAKFDLGWSKPWTLWDKAKTWVKRKGQSNVCADGSPGATVAWSSPDVCKNNKGEGGYCSSSSTNPAAGPYLLSNVSEAYKKTYTVPAGFSCATIQVNELSAPAMRKNKDFYRFYDASGKVVISKTGAAEAGTFSGSSNVQRYKVCSPSITVALESSANVPAGEYAGITVFFEPSN
jgi:hypothetical protein